MKFLLLALLLLCLSPLTGINILFAHGDDDHSAGGASGGAMSTTLNIEKEAQLLYKILTQPVDSGTFNKATQVMGIVVASPQGRAVVQTPQTGKIISLRTTPGQTVSAGQVVAVIEQTIDAGTQSSIAAQNSDWKARQNEAEAQSFNVIWAVESVCHAHDKADFIREAYQLLKPGGRLVMADFFKADHLTGADAALIKRWANGWAIDDFSTYSNFSNQLSIAGFALEKQEDATSKIIKSAKRLYYAYFPGIIGGFLYQLLHKNPTQFGKRNIDTALLQYKALKRQLWTYRLL